MLDNEIILKKAVEKAVKNGWKDEDNAWCEIGNCWDNRHISCFRLIIFSHDFAKAFWGEEKHIFMTVSGDKAKYLTIDFHGAWIPNVSWQYHLQQMVLEEEPIRYIEKFL